MSITAHQTATEIPYTPKENWTDLGRDGRKLSLIINQCFTKAYGKMRLKKGEVRKEVDPDHFINLVNTMVKCMLAKEKLAVTYLGVREVLAEAKKR